MQPRPPAAGDGSVGLKPDADVLGRRLRGSGGGAHRLEEKEEEEDRLAGTRFKRLDFTLQV